MLNLLEDHESLDCIHSLDVLHIDLPRGRELLIAGGFLQESGLLWMVTFGPGKQNFLTGYKTHIQQVDMRKQAEVTISQEKKKEDEMWMKSQSQEVLLMRRTHILYKLFFNILTVWSTSWGQVVCWGSLLATQQCFLLNPCQCASSSVFHSCKHCTDRRTQY